MTTVLTAYCVVIVAVSVAGGWIPRWVRLTHRRLEIALSFVSGVMLGVAILHLLPQAVAEHGLWLEAAGGGEHTHDAGGGHDHGDLDAVTLSLLAGFLVMFLLERSFCFHHHEPEEGPEGGAAHDHHQGHTLTWTGATIGLTVHALVAGAALAASVRSEAAGVDAASLAGFGTFLLIVLHKPFDALTIGTLIVAGNGSRRTHHVVNGLFGLTVPVGVVLFALGAGEAGAAVHRLLAIALAFSSGTFLCIALSDLLPELQFHRHDRVKLSIALVLGLATRIAG